jgi:hypothetical protein
MAIMYNRSARQFNKLSVFWFNISTFVEWSSTIEHTRQPLPPNAEVIYYIVLLSVTHTQALQICHLSLLLVAKQIGESKYAE